MQYVDESNELITIDGDEALKDALELALRDSFEENLPRTVMKVLVKSCQPRKATTCDYIYSSIPVLRVR